MDTESAATPATTTTDASSEQAPASSDVEVIDLTGLSDSSSDDEGGDGSDQEENGEGGSYDDDDDDDDGSEVEIPLNQETRTQLYTAISTVSEPRLRHVLKRLIDTDQAVEIALTRELITLKRETQAVVPRWHRCVHCEIEYDINTRREEDECTFHPGELEEDEEGFADWDEDCHGPKDTPENRIQYPHEFKWTCCDEDGTAPGCVRGQHKPVDISKKRKREEQH
ncbi:hypothetical protein CC1G_00596 [Coprinopsis cinerea okayama7|uniref:C2H2-type domain-containing protein n=1 Tax=Coprinopsis cinerea (strain Okayama-7 / 130 / ATCC MYA-4618 / FGSC 9003) TaxID=240176 RepID=A8N3S5_COPC7|nr:hypothetical protein CC1G_00596 [Coprinopsis cinerea okayama7\|eukprot:XP_001829417.1 hypothetical protein CC1G_00596 [Coprinopsis cinerea okayama7\